jgi:hypothetical protein
MRIECAPITFTQEQKWHSIVQDRDTPLFGTIDNDNVSLFTFAKVKQGIRNSVPIEKGSRITSFGGAKFIVASDTRLFSICDITDAYQTALSGTLEQAIEKLPCKREAIIAALFDQLWNSESYLRAIELVRMKIFEIIIPDVLRLFKFIKLGDSDRKFLLFDQPNDDGKVLKALTDSLLTVRASQPSEAIRRIVDTSLFQIYSYEEDIGRLASFIKDRPILSRSAMEDFFQGKESPAFALYLSYQGKIREAMDAFKQLQRFDDEVLIEIVNFMALNAKTTWPLIQENIIWLSKRSPIHACQVLSNEQVPLGQALGFSKQTLKAYYPEILFLTLFRSNLGNRPSLVAEYINLICPLLSAIRDQSSFNRSLVAFCVCVMRDSNASVDAIEEELGEHLIRVLRLFGKEVQEDIENIRKGMDERWPKSVKVEIFRATGNIGEALNLLWGSDASPDIRACRHFCREMSEPAAAFGKLIEKINLNPTFSPADRTKHLTDLLTRNMSAIDIPSAFKNLDANQPLEGEVATFLINSYRRLVALRKDTELEAAFAESNVFESEYQRIRLECQVLTLEPGTKCAKCGKDVNFKCVQREPNGMLCHIQCASPN